MTLLTVLFAIFSALLPVIGVVLPGLLKQDKFSPQINSVIAGVALVVIAALQAWSQNQIHLINPYLDFIAILTVMGSLLNGQLKGLDTYLTSFVSLLGLIPKNQPQTNVADVAVAPSTITPLSVPTEPLQILPTASDTSAETSLPNA